MKINLLTSRLVSSSLLLIIFFEIILPNANADYNTIQGAPVYTVVKDNKKTPKGLFYALVKKGKCMEAAKEYIKNPPTNSLWEIGSSFMRQYYSGNWEQYDSRTGSGCGCYRPVYSDTDIIPIFQSLNDWMDTTTCSYRNLQKDLAGIANAKKEQKRLEKMKKINAQIAIDKQNSLKERLRLYQCTQKFSESQLLFELVSVIESTVEEVIKNSGDNYSSRLSQFSKLSCDDFTIKVSSILNKETSIIDKEEGLSYKEPANIE